MSQFEKQVEKEMYRLMNEKNNLQNKLFENGKLSVEKIKKLDNSDTAYLKELALMNIAPYQFNNSFNIKNYETNQTLITTLASYNLKKRAIIYYIWGLYYASLKSLETATEKISQDQNKFQAEYQGKIEQNRKINQEVLEKIKKNFNINSDKSSNATVSGQAIIGVIDKLISQSQSEKEALNKTISETQQQVSDLQSDIKKYHDLLHQSWPVLAATLSADEIIPS